MNLDINTHVFFDQLEKNLPPVFSREEASRLLGRIISVGHFRNLDCQNRGPTVKVRLGKKICYERDSFIRWLRSYRGFIQH
jgi:hypothetical protein